MNILYTAYYGLGIGGAEVSMVMLARALRERHKIVIASTDDYAGFKTYRFNKIIKYVPSFYIQNIYMANFFSDIIKKEKIGIIHSHDSKTAVAAIMAAKKNNIKVVTHYRDYWFCCPRSSLLRPDLTNCNECNSDNLIRCSKKSRLLWDKHKLNYLNKIREILKKADAKMAISKAVNERLNLIGLDDARIIPNGIDLKIFREHRKKDKLDFGHIKIGYIGSLSYNKGMQNITGVIANILAKYKKTMFIVAGTGELKGKLMKDLDRFKNRAIFNDAIKYSEVIDLFKSLDIILIPSIWQEPFSRVAIEAMAAGKPIIESNVGGLKDIIKKTFGYLIEPTNAEGWQKAIELLLNKPIKRKLMGINAAKEAKKYDINRIANEVEIIYRKLT